jgi:hypothetical protein
MLIAAQGLGVATGPIQGHHLELPAALAQRGLPEYLLDQQQDLLVMTQRKLGPRQLFQCAQADLPEPPDVGLGELLVGELGQRLTP